MTSIKYLIPKNIDSIQINLLEHSKTVSTKYIAQYILDNYMYYVPTKGEKGEMGKRGNGEKGKEQKGKKGKRGK